MRRLILGSLIAAALLPAGVASAGGWATAGVGPPPDGGIGAGDTWNAQITILQHGNAQTPLVGVKPTLTIRNEAGKAVTFPAKPTKKAGLYVANVKFPSGGEWRYEVYDGFTQYGGAKTHTFGAITVGGPGSGDAASSFPLLPSIAGAVLVLIAAAGVVFLIRRQRRTAPAPA